jgi:hypothetical protein
VFVAPDVAHTTQPKPKFTPAPARIAHRQFSVAKAPAPRTLAEIAASLSLDEDDDQEDEDDGWEADNEHERQPGQQSYIKGGRRYWF